MRLARGPQIESPARRTKLLLRDDNSGRNGSQGRLARDLNFLHNESHDFIGKAPFERTKTSFNKGRVTAVEATSGPVEVVGKEDHPRRRDSEEAGIIFMERATIMQGRRSASDCGFAVVSLGMVEVH
eukprot:g7747.t1